MEPDGIVQRFPIMQKSSELSMSTLISPAKLYSMVIVQHATKTGLKVHCNVHLFDLKNGFCQDLGKLRNCARQAQIRLSSPFFLLRQQVYGQTAFKMFRYKQGFIYRRQWGI